MGRFIASLVIGLLLFGAVAYHLGYIQPTWFEKGPEVVDTPEGTPAAKHLKLGKWLYTPQFLELDQMAPVTAARKIDPILIPGQLRAVDTQQVSSTIDGQILFLGEEIPLAALHVAGVAPFLSDPCNYARIKHIEALIPGPMEKDRGVEFVDKWTTKIYRRLYKSQMVRENQVLAFLDPARAMSELRNKKTKLQSAEAEVRAAVATERESKANYERVRGLHQRGAAADHELSIALLTYIKSQEEAVGKEQAVKSARIELEQTQFILGQHEIINRLPVQSAVIKDIFHERGESVKPQDKIMELLSLDRLMADGLLEMQFLNRVKVGMPVSLEPTQEESPWRVFKAHRGEITAVAFTRDRLVVSGGDDKRVMVWDPTQGRPRFEFKHSEPIRALACSPAGAAQNWLMVGLADGSVVCWNLDDPSGALQSPRRIPENETAHRAAVTSLAISPDGRHLASGSVDAWLKLWDLESGQLRYDFDVNHGVAQGHQGTITSLHFTPQGRLVSAARDNSLRVWVMHEDGVKPHIEPILGRHGSVSQLGVSRDGRWMLFDQGKALQILGVADGHTHNTIQNPGGQIPFEALALFSPDASMLLTAGAPEGKLQLWSLPAAGGRAFEVRQFVTEERSPMTCAAFETNFAVSGSKDGYVYLWPIPTSAEVQSHRIRGLKLTAINYAIDVGTRQIPISVEVHNQVSPLYPNGRLIPGRPVTIVLEP